MANKSSKFKKGIVLEPQTSAPSSPVKGEAYYDNNDNKLKIHNGTTFKQALDTDDLSTHEADTSTHGVGTIVGTTETQTLTNKDIDGGTASNSNRITLPKAAKATLDGLTRKEATLVYASDLDKVYYDDGTNLRAVGSGSGSDINYIENGDAEIGTTGWVTYDDASNPPVDGTGGSPNRIALTQNTTNPLRDNADYKIVLTGASLATGEGVSYDFSIDKADQAKQLLISFDYDASHANYVDGDLALFIYDVTNAQLIRVNGENIMAGKGTHYARFQTASNSTSYRLILNSTQEAHGFDFYFDNVKVGPKSIVYGSPMTDWTSYTPTFTGFGTATNVEVSYRRVGSNIEIRGRFTLGTSTATEARISLPSGLSSISITNTPQLAGTYIQSATSAFSGYTAYESGTTYFVFTAQAASLAALSKLNGSQIGSSGAHLSFNTTIPIAGWAANSAMSEDFSGREITVYGRSNGGGAITANVTNIDFTEITDTTGSWNGTQFTVPETGQYLIIGMVRTTASTTTAVNLYIDGVADSAMTYNSISSFNKPIHMMRQFTKGDVLSFRGSVNATLDSAVPSDHWIQITKINSAQQIFETENISAVYRTNAGATMANTVDTTVVYEDLVSDTHSAYNTSTGIYTIPSSGKYSITANARLVGLNTAGTGAMYMFIDLNGASIARQIRHSGTQAVGQTEVHLHVSLNGYDFVKGDQVKIVVNQSNGAGRALGTVAADNSFSIARIK